MEPQAAFPVNFCWGRFTASAIKVHQGCINPQSPLHGRFASWLEKVRPGFEVMVPSDSWNFARLKKGHTTIRHDHSRFIFCQGPAKARPTQTRRAPRGRLQFLDTGSVLGCLCLCVCASVWRASVSWWVCVCVFLYVCGCARFLGGLCSKVSGWGRLGCSNWTTCKRPSRRGFTHDPWPLW